MNLLSIYFTILNIGLINLHGSAAVDKVTKETTDSRENTDNTLKHMNKHINSVNRSVADENSTEELNQLSEEDGSGGEDDLSAKTFLIEEDAEITEGNQSNESGDGNPIIADSSVSDEGDEDGDEYTQAGVDEEGLIPVKIDTTRSRPPSPEENNADVSENSMEETVDDTAEIGEEDESSEVADEHETEIPDVTNGVCMKELASTRQKGGMDFERHTEHTCVSLCFGLKDCFGADFDKVYNSCRIHQSLSNEDQLPDPCCNHYIKTACPKGMMENIDMGKVYSEAGGKSGKNGTNACDNVKVEIVKTELRSRYGGIKLREPPVMTEEDCVARCDKQALCSGVDYNKYENTCWIHLAGISTTVDRPKLTESTCCNHHEKTLTCENDCFDIYQYNRVNVKAVSRIVGAPIGKCKTKCLEDDKCEAFNYNSDESICLLYGEMTKFTGMVQSDVCCSLWIKTTCAGHRNDSLVVNEIYQPPALTTTTTIKPAPTTTRRQIYDFTFPDLILPTKPSTSESEEDNFWMSTSSIIVIAGCVFVLVVALIGLIAFAAHRRKERRKLENDALNPTNPRNWIINHRNRDSGGGLLAFWQSELHPDKRSDASSFPGRQTASLPPGRPTELELIPIQRGHAHTPYASDPLHVHLPEVTIRKHHHHQPPAYCTHVRPSTYPDSAQLSGIHSPKRLTRYEATSINNNDALYLDEFGDTDRFYRGGGTDRRYASSSPSGFS